MSGQSACAAWGWRIDVRLDGAAGGAWRINPQLRAFRRKGRASGLKIAVSWPAQAGFAARRVT